MQSSAAVVGRVLVILACVVGIPALAVSGSSWSELVRKLQDFRLSAILDPASVSTSTQYAEAARVPPTASPIAATATRGVLPLSTNVAVSPTDLATPPASAAIVADSAANERAADPSESIQNRLRQLGATYYILESWGSDQQMYRFCCKMAVGNNADFTRCFEAVRGDPMEAMTQVLHQVEAWCSKDRLADVSL